MIEQIKTESAPKAIGPYSQAIVTGDLVFVSGQLPINPKSGNIESATIERQTEQVIRNIESVLAAAGSGLSKVVKATVYLTDINDFGAFNKIYGNYFTSLPARSTVQVAKLPREAKLEIDVIASK